MEVIEECHEFFPMGEEIINSLFKKDDVDVKNERRLAKAISRLSGRQREILYLYYVKELSHQEISAILGMNPQSSKNLLSRTLARLREFFFSVSTIWIFSILVHCVHVPVRSVWAFHFS
jgi:DNA-binding CsgD family transcriptional regulator